MRRFADPIAVAFLFCLVVSLVFLAFPAIDLWVSSLFYDPAAGFPARQVPVLRLLRDTGDWSIWAIVIAALAGFLVKIAVPRRRSLLPPRASLFLLSTLILGPGLLVNLILKNNWGRPRPTAITAFGGDAPYVEVWRVSNFCATNCSFVAGEASSAIWLTGLAFLAPRRYRLPVLAVTGLWALALSLNRIAFGGHFASDVLLAWGLTALVMAVVYRILFVSPPYWLANERIEAALARLGGAIRRSFAAAARNGKDKGQ